MTEAAPSLVFKAAAQKAGQTRDPSPAAQQARTKIMISF